MSVNVSNALNRKKKNNVYVVEDEKGRKVNQKKVDFNSSRFNSTTNDREDSVSELRRKREQEEEERKRRQEEQKRKEEQQKQEEEQKKQEEQQRKEQRNNIVSKIGKMGLNTAEAAANVLNPLSAPINRILKNEAEKNIDKINNDEAKYVLKKTGAGVLSGTTGLVQAPLLESATQAYKGAKSDKSALGLGVNVIDSLANISNPQYGMTKLIQNIPQFYKEQADVISDKDKSLLQKIVSLGLNANNEATESVMPLEVYNSTLKLMGKLQPKTVDALLEMNNTISQPLENINEKLAAEGENYNKAIQYLGEGAQSIGNMLPSLAVSALTRDPLKAQSYSLGVMGLSAKGQSTQEALNKGADLELANKIGNAKALTEIGTEKMFGGINFLGEGTLDNIVEGKINQKVKNQMWNFLIKRGLDIPEEQTEEFVSYLVDLAIDKGTVDPSKKFSWKELLDTAITTAISTVGLNALGGGYSRNAYLQNAAEMQEANPLPTARQVEKTSQVTEVAPRAGQAIENIETAPVANEEQLYSNKIRQTATEEINNSNVPQSEKTMMLDILNKMDTVSDADLSAIRQTIQGINQAQQLETKGDYKNDQTRRQTYMKYKNDTSTYDSTAVDEVLDAIPQNRNGRRTVKQWLQAADEIGKRIANLSNEEIEKIAYKSWFDIQPSKSITQYDRQAKQQVGFQKFTSDEWINTINNAVNEARANNEVQQTVQQETQELPVVDQKNAISTEIPTSLVESAKQQGFKYKDMNLEQVQKALENKGIKSRFDVEEFSSKNEGAKWKLTRNDDGTVTREIILNPKANEETVIQEMAIHELTHDIIAKNTDTSIKLYKEVKQWLEKDTDYQEQLGNLKEIYGEDLAEEEAIAKTLQTKFGNQEEINRLVNYNPSMARRIYDWVVDKLNKITGGKIEKLYWEDVRNKFERAYNENGNYSNSKTKYSIQENAQGKKYIKVDTDQNVFEGIEEKDYNKIAKMYMQDYLKGKTELGEKDITNIGNKGINKYTNPKQTTKYITEKMQLTPELKNVLSIAEKVDNSLPTKDTSKYPNWEYYKFEFELSGKTFEGLINIGIDKKGNKHFYEINKIHITSNSYVSTNKFSNTDSINNSITSSKQNVNTTDYNMQKTKNNTQDNQGRTLSKQQQEYFKNSKATNENGQLEVVYHGTNKAGFTEFNRNWNYYTNNKKVAQSYTGGIEMVDTRRLESVSDAKSWLKGITDELYIEGNNVYDYDGEKILSYDNSDTLLKNLKRDIQKEVGDTNAGGTYQGYVNIEKPITIDAHNEIWSKIAIDNIDIEGIDNIEEFLKKYGSSVWKESGKLRTSTNDIVAAISDAIDNGDLDVDGVIIKNIYDEGGYGNTTPTEAGTDYITFNSNQFKALDNFSPTSNSDIRYSISDTQEDRLSKLNEDWDLSDKLREELYGQRDELQKQYKDIINSEEYKNAVKEVVKMNPSQVEKTKEYELMKKAQNIKNQINDIQDEIDIATSEMRRLSEAIDNEEKQHRNPEESIKQAKKKLGLTNNFKEAGYMLQDGSLLDFSGRSQGSNAYNQRTMDHREINEFGYDMNEFIDLGNIRMQPESNGFELMKEPTERQYSKLKEYINNADGEVYIDIYKNGKMGTYDSAEYKKGTPTNKIINDLQYYFKNGKFPEKSQFADFMYSKKQKGFDQYLESRIGKKGTRTTLGDLKSTYNAAPTADNKLAISEYTKKQTLNPTEIANTNKESMNTTPKLETKNYKPGNKQSSFVSNILNDAQFLNKDLRQEMGKDENIRYYSGITNAETLEKAYNSLTEGGEKETLNWFSKNEKNTTAEDVAKGWILLKQYQDSGDYQGAVEVAKKMRQMGTSAGQAVQAYNIMARMSPEGMFYYAQSELNEAYNKMVEGKSKQWIEKNQDKFTLTPEETQTIIDTMKEVSEMEDGREKNVKLAQIQELVSSKIPPTAGQSVKAWMRISMLFNPKTQVRNVMGNTVVLPVNATADVFSGAIDKLISKKTGVRTTGVTREGIKGYGKGFRKGLFESYDDFRKGINTRNVEGNRFEIGEGKSFKDKGVGKALNRIDNILSFSLDAGDRGFYEASFTNSINNQLVLNKTNQVTQEMIDIATNEALQRTWQDNNSYTEVVLSIRRNLNKFNVKGYGLGDVLIPFAKTPANLTKAIVDYSPVGLTKTLTLDAKKFNNSLHNGQYSAQLQHQFVQNLGKGMAGSLLYALGYGLAKAGFATGESDDDKDVKNFMKNSLGIGSYSIKIGNKSFTYDWAQPVATPLAIMTNYVKYSKDNPDAKAVEKAIKSLDIGSEQLLKQSFMESINTVLNGSGTTMENLTQAVLDLPARAVPTFSKQIADMVDSTQRTSFEYGQPVQSAINSVVAKIPFASRTLPASIDTLGNEIQKYGGNNNIWNVMINPANKNKGQLSKAGEEIYKVYMETGDTTIFPRTAPYYINSKGEKITMTAQERSKFQTTTGKYVESSLSSLIKDSDYKKLNNEEKAKIINEIVSDSYSKAKYDVLKIDSKEYEKLRTTLQDIKPSTYYNYKFKTEGMKKDNEKISVLIDSNYTNAEKTKIYETYIGTNDDKYNIMKNTNININEYLKYKTQDFSADKEDDGTINGKSISGSAKNKRWNYINNMNVTYMQKLMLYGMEYTVSDNEQAQIVNYINSLSIPKDEKLEMLSHFKGFTIYKDGSFKY